MERQHGSVTGGMIANARQKRAEAKSQGVPYRRGARLYSFPEGLRLLVETLASQLRLPLIQGVAVQRIEREERGWRVVGEGRDRWQADAVVLACPAYSQARIVAEVAPDLANLMQQIPYAAAVVVGLGFRRSDIPMSLDGFGYIAPQHTRQDLLGVQWCSSVYPQRAPEGMVLLRAIAGGWNRPEIVGWPETQLVSAIRAELRLAMGIAAPPAFQRVVRWERAIPQYHVGHLKRLVELEAGLARYPGLFLTGNAYHGVAMNDCTEQASLVAQRVQAYLAQPVT
jgi:oxygen-dependent protoporphyrinogen oxidase